MHIAPEPIIETLLKTLPNIDYLSGDLMDSRAMEKMDITDIQHPDDSFDLILCSHVLEHVPDDRKAMSEFKRVLKPGGFAMLLVPITTYQTDEDPTVTDPNERLRRFGQDDHVRRYGLDYVDRLRDTGFNVEVIPPVEQFDYEQLLRMGIPVKAPPLFICT